MATSSSSLYFGKNTIDLLSLAKNILETLYFGPTKHDHLVFAQQKAQDSFPGKQWKCSSAKRFQLEVAPSTAGQKRMPWMTLCGSLHSGSTNSGSVHTARSPFPSRGCPGSFIWSPWSPINHEAAAGSQELFRRQGLNHYRSDIKIRIL